MGKKGSGVNTKVAAAKERQEQVASSKTAKTRAAEEAEQAREWAKGSNQKGSKKEEEAARKQEEKMAKLAAKKAAEEEDAKELAGFKSVVKPKKKVEVPPWEAALISSSTMSNKERKRQEAAKRQAEAEAARKAKAERAEAEAKAMRDAGIQMVDDSELLEGSANPNRRGGGEVEEWASGIDAALASLGVDGGAGAGAERHPEKRMKAALLAYEERELPRLKEEKPGLKLRQYKEMIFQQFQKSPENPINRARAAEAKEAAGTSGK
ncbi:unnamed protein product [Ascophyllum nodosum]